MPASMFVAPSSESNMALGGLAAEQLLDAMVQMLYWYAPLF